MSPRQTPLRLHYLGGQSKDSANITKKGETEKFAMDHEVAFMVKSHVGGTRFDVHAKCKALCRLCDGHGVCDHRKDPQGCAICSPFKYDGCGLYVVRNEDEEGRRLCWYRK
jgi:hypothetical protein